MPSLQVTLNQNYSSVSKRGFALQLSPIGGNPGTPQKLRFRLSSGPVNANNEISGYVVSTESLNGDNPTVSSSRFDILNATSPTTPVTFTSLPFNSSTVNIPTLVSESGLLHFYIESTFVLPKTLTIELLTASDSILDTVTVPLRNTNLSSGILGYRTLPNEATALVDYLSNTSSIFDKLVRAQSGSIIVYPRQDSEPIRLVFTDPITFSPSIETRALSAATIAQPFDFTFEFKVSTLAKEMVDFIYSLTRDGILRANNVPSEPPIFEVQVRGSNFVQVIRNCSLIPLISFNLNAGEVNVDNNFIGGRFTKIMTLKELFEGYYEV